MTEISNFKFEISDKPAAAFTLAELRRVGTAATMIVVCGTIIIISMTMMMGHYNSLAHAGPKAVLDGAVIALLIGARGRWRCLSLLGVVYGLVLLLQIGVVYLLPVMALAGIFAAGAGRAVDLVHRGAALFAAAVLYELFAGFGAPIKIYFATDGKSEPFLWGMWFAEWPLRIIGASVGVWLARRWQVRRNEDFRLGATGGGAARLPIAHDGASADECRAAPPPVSRMKVSRTTGTWSASLRLIMCVVACTVPLSIDSSLTLGLIAGAFVIYALWAGMRFRVLHALLGLLGGWFIYGLFSYAWHQDLARVLDLHRTLVLRFAPLALASMVLVATVRPVDLVRLLRRLRVSGSVLIPLASVARSIPQSCRAMRASIEALRAAGHWNGPLSLLRRPGTIVRGLLGPQVKQWASELAAEDSRTQRS